MEHIFNQIFAGTNQPASSRSDSQQQHDNEHKSQRHDQEGRPIGSRNPSYNSASGVWPSLNLDNQNLLAQIQGLPSLLTQQHVPRQEGHASAMQQEDNHLLLAAQFLQNNSSQLPQEEHITFPQHLSANTALSSSQSSLHQYHGNTSLSQQAEIEYKTIDSEKVPLARRSRKRSLSSDYGGQPTIHEHFIDRTQPRASNESQEDSSRQKQPLYSFNQPPSASSGLVHPPLASFLDQQKKASLPSQAMTTLFHDQITAPNQGHDRTSGHSQSLPLSSSTQQPTQQWSQNLPQSFTLPNFQPQQRPLATLPEHNFIHQMSQQQQVERAEQGFQGERSPHNALPYLPAESVASSTQSDKHSREPKKEGLLLPDGRRIVPCKARGVPEDHTPKTAFLVISKDAKHGEFLRCSYPLCTRQRFRYCSVCEIPVAKKNFTTRHGHEDIFRGHGNLEMQKHEEAAPTLQVEGQQSGKLQLGNSEDIEQSQGKRVHGRGIEQNIGAESARPENWGKQKSRQLLLSPTNISSVDTQPPPSNESSVPLMPASRVPPSTSRESTGVMSHRSQATSYQGLPPSFRETTNISNLPDDVEAKWLSLLLSRPPIEDSEKMALWLKQVATFGVSNSMTDTHSHQEDHEIKRSAERSSAIEEKMESADSMLPSTVNEASIRERLMFGLKNSTDDDGKSSKTNQSPPRRNREDDSPPGDCRTS